MPCDSYWYFRFAWDSLSNETKGSFYYPLELESHGSVPWGLKPGYRVTEPCQVSLDRKPLSAGPGDSFFVGHKVRCLTGFLVLWCFFFLIDDITHKPFDRHNVISKYVFYRSLSTCRVLKFVKKSLDEDLWIIAHVSSCLLFLEPGNVLWINR